jgi:hypothetical protein
LIEFVLRLLLGGFDGSLAAMYRAKLSPLPLNWVRFVVLEVISVDRCTDLVTGGWYAALAVVRYSRRSIDSFL